MIWLFVYVLVVSVYDLRTGKIPNWCTYPLIVAGLIAHFPGHLDLWLASLALLSAWVSDWMGAGDVKLWLALFWSMPTEHSSQALLLMSASFLLTALCK